MYEKSNITDYIRTQRGRTACPMAGASHMISLADLNPATKVINAKRRGTLKKRVEADDIEDLS